MDKKNVLSGIQATGRLTLGNYIGALASWTNMQDQKFYDGESCYEYNSYYMIANLHTLTIRTDPEELKNNTLKILALYIACRARPRKKYYIYTITSKRA